MNNCLKKFFFLAVFLTASFLIYAQDPVVARKPLSQYDFPGMKQKLSLDLQNMNIVDTLKYLAVKGDLNIVTGANVSGTVNLLLSGVTIGDVLDIVLVINNLAYEVQGNIIKIITADEYKILYGDDFYDQRSVEILQLKYASTANIGAMLGDIKSAIGKVVYDADTGTVILVDTPEKIKQMKDVINKSELPTVNRIYPTQTETFTLQYAKVEDIKDKVTAVLTSNVGSLHTDTRTNRFVVVDLPNKIEEVKSIIKAFDAKTQEVFIEAKIVQVTLDDHFEWGIDWDQLSGLGDSMTFHPEITLPQTLTGTYGKLTVVNTTSDLSMVLEALNSLTETKILSNPHLAVVDGKEAKMVVATKQPYALSTSTVSEGTTTTATDITFVDVGVTLTVIPTINEEEFITMDIKAEVTEATGTYTYGTDNTEVPIVATRDAETTVMVKDGTTIIIAGLIKDEKRYTKKKVPLLGDIPFVGRFLFGYEDDQVIRTETIVFLTPRIIGGDMPFRLGRDIKKDRFPKRE